MNKPQAQLLVIFGASGDLTKRKLIPALYNLYNNNLLPNNFCILGVSRTSYTDNAFRKTIIDFYNNQNQEAPTDDFLKLLHYQPVETSNTDAYKPLCQRISKLDAHYNTENNIVYYLSTPPELYKTIPLGLEKTGLNACSKADGKRKIIIEKPFGTNLNSARELNHFLLQRFNEDEIYRIDHYLGKETVQNLMVTRFSNGIFEPLWNRNYIRHIEITSSEKIGVGNRGGYYDKSGAVRDMVQNHLLQIAGLVAMEPPTRINSHAIRNEQLKVFQSLRPIDLSSPEQQVIRGQYLASTIKGEKVKGYRQEKGVAPNSRTETFAALKFYIDNWRWGGVPFYIRTGKYLPTRVTEIVIHFKPTPHKLFNFSSSSIEKGNMLIIRIQPDEGILLKFGAKIPGTGFHVQDVNMDFHYSELTDIQIPDAYQRLLLDAMKDDATLYIRGDAVEYAWRFIDPVLQHWDNYPDFPLYGYPAGTWGPAISDSLISGDNYTWRYPCRNLANDGNFCEL